MAAGLFAALLAFASPGTAAVTGDTGATLRFGGDAHYPPYHFIDAGGRPDGFDIGLVRELAADMGMQPSFELDDWSSTLDRLARGELDLVPMFWSAEREQRFLLTEPILLRHHALFGHYETPAVASLDTLADVRVAVQRSGLAWEAMREQAGTGISLIELDNEGQALELVARGDADYALVPTGIGYHAIQHYDLEHIVALSPPLLERKYVFAVAPHRPALAPAINRSLERLRRSGVQNRLYVEWIGNPGATGAVRSPAWSRGTTALAVTTCVLLLAGLGLPAWRRRAARRSPSKPATTPAGAVEVDPQLLADLRASIDDGSLGFALQPKIDLRSGRWLGAELLVRWNHPKRGRLAPDDFVPAAEQAGAIEEMTLYLVRRGLEQSRHWPDSGDPLHLSVNVSANDLAEPRLVDAIIEASRGGCSRLMLEVTETAVMREPERVCAALPRLREHGIRISVDDFGAGHSSLVNLRRLAPDELKIDRSFVSDLMTSGSDRAIVRAIIQLGHELDALITAEGIEDAATRSWLAEAGCDAGQGFGIARPMPPTDFVRLLRVGA